MYGFPFLRHLCFKAVNDAKCDSKAVHVIEGAYLNSTRWVIVSVGILLEDQLGTEGWEGEIGHAKESIQPSSHI